MNYGFIGSGNIAVALIKGAIKSGKIKSHEVFIYDSNITVQNKISAEHGVIGVENPEALIHQTDLVFLAVKPPVMPLVLSSIQNCLGEQKRPVVSLAASVKLETMANYLKPQHPILRVMPNLNAAVCSGVNAICKNTYATDNHLHITEKFLNSSGTVHRIDEKEFDLFAALAGCSPAFTYLFMESLAKGAHKHGMNKQEALRIAAQTVLGSAKMLLDSPDHPCLLIDKVCSPGGMTIRGICSLEANGFSPTVVQAMEASMK